jgi:hypothetical protein
MKVACLLPLPLLLVPFTHAADYLIRFKEGAAPASQQPGISRIEHFASVQSAGAHPKFDYHSNELSLTVLSISQAKALATHGGKNNKHRHGKSKAQVETAATGGAAGEEIAEEEAAVQIKSKGRWFTFDDTEFHVWHGDFSEAEAKLLAQDAGVEMVEKDVVIRFPELEQYNNQTAMARKVMNLDQAYDLVDEHISALELKSKKDKNKDKNDAMVHIPNVDENEKLPSPRKSSKKAHQVNEFVQPITAEDIPGPNNAYTIQQRAPSWVSCLAPLSVIVVPSVVPLICPCQVA